MRIAILGTGAIGLGAAALASDSDHKVYLWSPGLARDRRSGAALVEASGALVMSCPVFVSRSAAEAVGDAEVIVVAVPGYAHRAVFDEIVPHLSSGQTIVISSHTSLSALYLSKALAARSIEPCIVAWGTTVTAGRRTGPLQVSVSHVREKVDGVGLPVKKTTAGLALCRTLFGDRFVARQDLLAISLSNVNPQNHMAMVLCNLTRIERGEDWGNYACITPAVGRLMEALDEERLAIAKRLGLSVRTLREHFHLSFQVPIGPIAEAAQIIDARGNAPLGPKSLDSRYVLEDVPYGLVATHRLAAMASVEVPLHAAGITLFSALYGRDFFRENNILPGLGLQTMPLARLRELAHEGWPHGQQ